MRELRNTICGRMPPQFAVAKIHNTLKHVDIMVRLSTAITLININIYYLFCLTGDGLETLMMGIKMCAMVMTAGNHYMILKASKVTQVLISWSLKMHQIDRLISVASPNQQLTFWNGVDCILDKCKILIRWIFKLKIQIIINVFS